MNRHARILCIILALFTTFSSSPLFAVDKTEDAGSMLQYILPAAAAGLTLVYKDGEGAVQLGESLVVTMGITTALKYAVNEKRPTGGGQSFPSGHTSFSFSAAEFIRERYGWEYGLPAYALASFVGYSRVEANKHYAHDVAAGAAIGILSSYFLTTPYQGWTIGVEGDTKSIGLTLSGHF
jgi:membrane-associated phospholipid phosphatase